jgi:hypothetical protein
LWLGHDKGVPNPGGAGEWRSVPEALRPLFRRKTGPVLIGTVTLQLALLSFVGFVLVSVVAPPLLALAYYIVALLWVLMALSWALVWVRSRLWKRPDG